jgi:hypothetical protein
MHKCMPTQESAQVYPVKRVKAEKEDASATRIEWGNGIASANFHLKVSVA